MYELKCSFLQLWNEKENLMKKENVNPYTGDATRPTCYAAGWKSLNRSNI